VGGEAVGLYHYQLAFSNPDGERGELICASDVKLSEGVVLATQFMSVAPSANGVIYTGGPPAVTWQQVPNFLAQSASVSINVKASYVTPAGATVTLNGVLPAGWAYSSVTNLLTYDGVTVNGTPTTGLSFTASFLGASANSNSFSVQGAGVSSADTLAPTIPIALSASAISASGAQVSGIMPSDPNQPGHVWKGLSQINVLVNAILN